MIAIVFMLGVMAMYTGMMAHATADPLELLDGADRTKLRLGTGTGFIFSPQNSMLLGLSLKSTASAADDGPSSVFGDSSEVNLDRKGQPMTIDGIVIGAQHQLNDQWAVLANLAWIKSQLYDDLTQRAPPDIIVPLIWDETTRYILGVVFMPADRWAVRAEVSLDRPFINFSSEKDQTVPEQSRLWFAAAVDYRIGNDLSFDLEYTRLSVKDGGPLSKSAPSDAAGHDNDVVAERPENLDIISATLTIQF